MKKNYIFSTSTHILESVYVPGDSIWGMSIPHSSEMPTSDPLKYIMDNPILIDLSVWENPSEYIGLILAYFFSGWAKNWLKKKEHSDPGFKLSQWRRVSNKTFRTMDKNLR